MNSCTYVMQCQDTASDYTSGASLFAMAAVAETPVMELSTETSVVEPAIAEEEPHQDAAEVPAVQVQHFAPTSVVYAAPVTYSAAPVTYIAAPTMMAPPPTVSHYVWNGVQYPSMEAALSAMMAEASKPAPAPEVEEEPKDEPQQESPEETSEVKTRAVKPVKKGCC